MDQDELRMTIREKLARGALPREQCQVTWFGPGAGHRCVACERTISGAGTPRAPHPMNSPPFGESHCPV